MNRIQFAAGLLAMMLSAVASAQPYNGPGFIIPDNDPLGSSSNIVVTDPGFVPGGGLFAVSISFGNPPHTWAGDLIVTLAHNNGVDTVTTDIFRRIGKTTTSSIDFGNSADLNGTYRFSDSALLPFWNPPTQLPGPTAVPGDYRATTNLFNGQPGPIVALDSIFAGRTWAGTWTLRVSDNAAGDVGAVSGWQIGLVPSPGALALMAVAGFVGSRRRRQ